MKKSFAKKALFALLISAFLFEAAACSGGESVQSTDITGTGESNAAAETAAAETTVHYEADYLPDADYEGYDFRMITMIDDICVADVEVMNGDVFNDSFYTRNRKIEQDYNVKLSQTAANGWNEQYSILKKSVNAATDDFDTIRLIMREAFPAAQDDYTVPISDLPYCDPSQPWYVRYMNDELTFGEELPVAYTDECLATYMYTETVFFNKRMAGDYNLGDLYDTVRNGTWTYDKFFDMAKAVISDVDGSGNFDITTDTFGYMSRWDNYVHGFWVGAGMKTVKKDDDNLPYFEADQNLYTLLEDLFEKTTGDGTYYDYWYDMADRGLTYDDFMPYFADGHALFVLDGVSVCGNLRDMNDDFGILPMPKKDEAQSSYYSSVSDGYVNVVPATASDIERTSVMLEALAIESKNIVVPAYIEKAVESKYLRDEDSVEMFRLILDTRMIDLGCTVWMDPIRTTIVDNCFRKGKNTFASAVAAKQESIDKTIQKVIEALEDEE